MTPPTFGSDDSRFDGRFAFTLGTCSLAMLAKEMPRLPRGRSLTQCASSFGDRVAASAVLRSISVSASLEVEAESLAQRETDSLGFTRVEVEAEVEVEVEAEVEVEMEVFAEVEAEVEVEVEMEAEVEVEVEVEVAMEVEVVSTISKVSGKLGAIATSLG